MSAVSWLILLLISASPVVPGAGVAPCLLATAAAALAVYAALGPGLRPLSAGAIAVMAAWIGIAALDLCTAPDPREAFVRVSLLLGALALFGAAHAAVPPAERGRLLAGLGLSGVAVVGVALLLAPPGAAPRAPFEAPEQLAGWLLLPLVVGLAGLCPCAGDGRSARWNIGWFSVVALCGAGIAASRVPGAAFAAGLSAATLLVMERTGRRGFAAGVAAFGIGLVSLVPAMEPTTAVGVARAGFTPSPLLSALDGMGTARVAALLLSAAVALRGIRPLRHGKGSLAAWGGAGAVFAVATWSLMDAPDPAPAVVLGVACLAGLAWPARARGFAGRRASRAALAGLSVAVVGCALASVLLAS